MKIINFYGAPGCGKSTLASELFVYMKKNGYNVEIASEYAKDCIYEEKFLTMQDQIYLLAKMNHKFQVFKNAKLDYVICDSPLLLNMFYKRHQYKMNYLNDKVFDDFTIALNNTYNRVNIFLVRDNSILYQQNGRIESNEESINYSDKIEKLLIDNNEPYTKIINNKDLNIEQVFAIVQG